MNETDKTCTNPYYADQEAEARRKDELVIRALRTHVEALEADGVHAEEGLLRYENALRKIENFSVDDANPVALKMGEVAREALRPWRDNVEAQKLIDAING